MKQYGYLVTLVGLCASVACNLLVEDNPKFSGTNDTDEGGSDSGPPSMPPPQPGWLVVGPDQVGAVYGNGHVYLVRADKRAGTCEPQTPLSFGPLMMYRCRRQPGQRERRHDRTAKPVLIIDHGPATSQTPRQLAKAIQALQITTK